MEAIFGVMLFALLLSGHEMQLNKMLFLRPDVKV